jgi:hypothetical protein
MMAIYIFPNQPVHTSLSILEQVYGIFNLFECAFTIIMKYIACRFYWRWD